MRMNMGVDGHTPNQQRRTATDSRGVFSAVGSVWSRMLAFATFCLSSLLTTPMEHALIY